MEAWMREIVLPSLLTTDTRTLNEFFANNVDPDVTFGDAVMTLKGREEMQQLYRAWSKMCGIHGREYFYDKVEIVANEEQGVVYTDITYRFHPVYTLFHEQTARVVSKFSILTEENNKYKIFRQEDFYFPPDLVPAILPPFMADPVRQFLLMAIRAHGWWTTHLLLPMVERVLPLLEGRLSQYKPSSEQ